MCAGSRHGYTMDDPNPSAATTQKSGETLPEAISHRFYYYFYSMLQLRRRSPVWDAARAGALLTAGTYPPAKNEKEQRQPQFLPLPEEGPAVPS